MRLSSVVVLVDTWCLLVLLQVQAPGTGSEGSVVRNSTRGLLKQARLKERIHSLIQNSFYKISKLVLYCKEHIVLS